MLNVQGLTNETNEERSVVSENYDLLRDSTTLTWSGNIININKPSGVSELQNINFRSWTGEMLPFTQQNLPDLKCQVLMKTQDITTAYVNGKINPWSNSRFIASNMATSTIFNFTKAWTYNKDEASQIMYNVNDCVNIANERMKTLFPKMEGGYGYQYGGNTFNSIKDEGIHLSRLSYGSGAVGVDSINSPKVKVYNGTAVPLDVAFEYTNTGSGSNEFCVSMCYTNYNNSILINNYSRHIGSFNTTYGDIAFNWSTDDQAYFHETYQFSYIWDNALTFDRKRYIGGAFAIIKDIYDHSYNAYMNSTLYGDQTLSGVGLWVADTTATNKYTYINIFTKADWTTFMSTNLGLVDNTWCHVLAFNTLIEEGEEEDPPTCWLYVLCATPQTRYNDQMYYVFFRVSIDLSLESKDTPEFLGYYHASSASFKESLAYKYQYGADVGELAASVVDDAEFYNFGYKYVVKRWSSTNLSIVQLQSSVWDIDSVGGKLYYIVKDIGGDYQSIATITSFAPHTVFNNEGIEGSKTVDNLHAYYLLCERGDSLNNPYDCTVKARVRNVTDEYPLTNPDMFYDLSEYYLGSNNEDDTVYNIEPKTCIFMTVDNTTPSCSIYSPVVKEDVSYASVMAGFENWFISSGGLTGQCTRPTLILVDNSLNYYQVSFVLRIYTDPYYFEMYTGASDYNVSGNLSLMFGPVDWVYHEVNEHVRTTLESLILMHYEFNDIALRCLNFPSYDNIVFNIGEIARIDFKKLQTTSSLSRLQFQVVDSSGNIIEREALATLYGSLVLSLDWCY